MRTVTKAQMIQYYEEDILRDILFLGDQILARKVAHGSGLEETSTEVVRCEYP